MMFGIFGKKDKKVDDAEEKRIAMRGSKRERVDLAGNPRASQEILYYMALHDSLPTVKKAVAGNASMPLQAGTLLAKDKTPDVRLTLAKRLVKILPDLSGEQHSQLYAYAVQSLGMLALDEVLKIRRALTETLKDHAYAPPSVAAQLGRDLEREVSEPILRFCAALADEDLIDILKTHPANWAAEAVASRKSLSAPVSRAVVDTGNVRAGAILIKNEGAVIDDPLYETIVERAQEHPEWHAPLAARASLPPRMAMKLSAYVDKTVMHMLENRKDIDRQTLADMRAAVQRRMEYEDTRKKSVVTKDPQARAAELNRRGELTEQVMSDALAMQDTDFVFYALAFKAGTDIRDIKKVFEARAPKSICAIVWKAGFSMRLALKLQQMPGRVPHTALIYPRGGTDYPFTADEMRHHLGLIGL